MGLSKKEKDKIGSYLGIETKELFNSFYIIIDKRSFLKNESFNSSVKKIKISGRDYLGGITLAWGHPVFLNIFAAEVGTSKNDYRYFKVKKRSITNIRATCAPIFLAESCKFSLEDELNKNSPEFSKRFLLKIARRTPFPDLKAKVMDFLNENELIEYLSQYEDYDYTLRQIAILRIKDQNFLINTVFNKKECAVVKSAAISNIKDPYFLTETILFNAKEDLVITKIFWRICELVEQNFISKDIFVDIATAEGLPMTIKKEALVRIDDRIRALINLNKN